jgi:RecB family exonuclease
MEHFNGTLSYSKLKRYEQCPQSYYLHYVLNETPEPNDSLVFGSMIHKVLETYYRRKRDEHYVGPVEAKELINLFKQLWIEAGLTSQELFEDGIKILTDYAQRNTSFDFTQVLAIEREFELPVGKFKVIGFIDRIDLVAPDGIAITDYKTNRIIFSRDEVDHDLQLSIYQLAARKLYPEAANIIPAFYLLRHNIRMAAQRSEADLELAREYIQTLGLQIESATDFPARLNPNCPYCDHRGGCEKYQKVLSGEMPLPEVDTKNLESVAATREQAASIAKIAYAKKAEMEDVLKSHLKHQEALVLEGVEYSMSSMTKLAYPADKTLAFLSQVSGIPQAELYQKLAVLDNSKVDNFVKGLRKGRKLAEYVQIKGQLEALAEKSYSPRFCARKVK